VTQDHKVQQVCKEPPVLQAYKVLLDLKGLPEQLVKREHKARPEHKEPRGKPVLREQLAYKELQVPTEPMVLRELQDLKALAALTELTAPRVRQVPREPRGLKAF
jgi:hypothetical protein